MAENILKKLVNNSQIAIDDGVYDRTSWDKSQTGDEFNVDVVNWMLQFKRND